MSRNQHARGYPLVFTTYENRASCLVAVKILVRSLARQMPLARIRIRCPGDDPAFVEFAYWLETQENVLPAPGREPHGTGWNVKPSMLLYELEQGANEAIWIDSDIAVGRDPTLLLLADNHTLVATAGMRWDETEQGTAKRTAGLGMQIGRHIPGIVSSSIVRATNEHRGLLEEWDRLLESPDYLYWQQQPFWERPVHAAGDQDVLMGLLGAAEFSWIPIKFIPSGRGIAHCFFSLGYTTSERLGNTFRGTPPFVHAPSPVKPWNAAPSLSVELSPYPWLAARYHDEIGESMEWTRPRSSVARVLNALFLGEPNLRGLPLSVISEARAHLDRWIARRRRRPSGSSHVAWPRGNPASSPAK